jgi:hypothetical protein
MSYRNIMFVFLFTIPLQVLAQSEISVGIVKNSVDANVEVTISDSYHGFGDTIYVADNYIGFGKTFYITDDMNSADLILRKPPQPGEPKSADFRLYVHKNYPGFGDTIYIADNYPGFGKTVYFAKNYPGFGESLYIEDPLLRFNKKAIAFILFKLGQL